MYKGYTKRWRKRWEKGYHKDFLLWIMMDYFIDHANYEEKEFPYVWKGKLVEMVKVKRGEHFFTISGLMEKLRGPQNKVTRKAVRGRVEILKKIGFLEVQSTQHYSIATILNYDKYNPLSDSEGQTIGPTMEHQSTHQKPTTNKYKEIKEYNIPYVEIVSFLNEKAGTNFKPTSKETQRHISARWKEGFVLADFKSVIEKKTAQWKTDPKMSEFLRPKTLFGTNFESYLNVKGGVTDDRFKNINTSLFRERDEETRSGLQGEQAIGR